MDLEKVLEICREVNTAISTLSTMGLRFTGEVKLETLLEALPSLLAAGKP